MESGGTRGPEGAEAAKDSVHVEEIDGVHVVRTVGEPPLDPMSVAELGYAMAARGDTTLTVVIGTEGDRAWAGLDEVLRAQRPGSYEELLLVLSHAAAPRGEGRAVAHNIAERLRVRVVAPDGPALLVPGGSLFVPERADREEAAASAGSGAGAERDRGWWRFTPGGEPEALGRQLPAPAWQADLDRLPRTAAASGETAVHRIPAGIALRPIDAPAPLPGDLAFAVPVSPDRPVVLVGAPGDEIELTPHDVVGVLSSLPAPVRSAVRLAPGGNSDLLPAGQLAADTFRLEVEVLTGSPLMTDDLTPGSDAHQARTVLIGTDGTPAWRPFVEAVACRPGVDGPPPAPQLLRWQPPLPGVGTARTGVLRISDTWQVAVTRAGLRVTRVGTAPVALAERPVDADAPAIEVGTPGRPIGPDALPALRTLLTALSPEVRERAVLHLYGECGTEQARELSRLLSEHGVKRLRTRPPRAAAPARPAARPPALPAPPRRPVKASPGAIAPGPSARPALASASAAPAVPAPPAAPAPDAPGPAPRRDAPPAPAQPVPVPPEAPAPAAPPAKTAAAPGAVPPRKAETAPAPVPAAFPAVLPRPVLAPTFGPRYRSSAAERDAFRELVPDDVWDPQEKAVQRMLGAPPGEGGQKWAPNPVDVLAVHLYLTSRSGPLAHEAVRTALRAGDPRLRPYAACIASGLARMMPYQGPAFRSGDPLPKELAAPGRLLRAPGPVSALAGNLRGPSEATRYAVWSEYGRRVHLERDPALPGVPPPIPDEVLFAPGTAFRVLGVHAARGTDVVLLREVTGGASTRGAAADDQDRTALRSLTEALEEDVPAGSRGRVHHWPPRCTGPAGWA
ncbi:hypothetical protein SAMN05216223_101270 [Actinacidiphila yanglinensis]|uniref:Uncharacterized protein n=1 Tax=Actinacidiphila yanglinensis TaxID=310779 RepID=A0A1H5ST95_9ACTN|nr:hypothetical protein SAMN05216223_101270 [Actinacidiphila yanglinensis]